MNHTRLYAHAARTAIAAVICLTACISRSGAAPLRIGLTRHFAQSKRITVCIDEGARVYNQDDEPLAKGPGEWQFEITKSGLRAVTDQEDVLASETIVRFVPDDSEGIIRIRAANDKRIYRYRGIIEVRANPPQSKRPADIPQVVNVIDIETYLRGVVAREIGETAPTEALKAQAVVARTYALMARGKYPNEGYDLRDTTECQAYDGVNAERPISDGAVRQTAGQIVTRDGRMVFTDYSDDCGGVTAPNTDGPYADSVVDGPDENSPAYCAKGPNHTWKICVKPGDLQKLLPKGAGDLVDVTIMRTDTSGRATLVRITGDEARRDLTGEQLRAALGYERLKSTLFSVTQDASGGFVFSGRGNGHGLGLCQTGAIRMASAPFNATYTEIVAHYFPGATIDTWQDRAGSRVASAPQKPSRSRRTSAHEPKRRP